MITRLQSCFFTRSAYFAPTGSPSDGREQQSEYRQSAEISPLEERTSGNPSGRPKSKTLLNADRSKPEEPLPNDPEGRTWAELIAEKSLIVRKGERVNPSTLRTRRSLESTRE